MSRIGRLYYAVINKTTGRVDHDCPVCSVHEVNVLIGLPTPDINHSVESLSIKDYGLMSEFNQNTRMLKNKWDKGQGKPVEDK